MRKGLLFASLFGLASGMAAHAAPAVNLIGTEGAGTPIVKADYYDPGYDYGVPPYDGGIRRYYGGGLADGDLIGGALGIIGGAIGGALHGPDYYARPYYGPGYGAPYYGGPNYNGEPSEAACGPDSPYFDPASGTCPPGNGEEFLYPDR